MKKILHNGKIITMETQQPYAEAMEIRDNLIYRVGSNEEILKYKDGADEIIDLEGKLLLPAFQDSHLHTLETVTTMGYLNVSECTSLKEIQEAILDKIKDYPEDKVCVVIGIDENKFEDRQFPTQEDMNAVSDKVPIFALRRCMNIAMLNAPALKYFADELEVIRVKVNGGADEDADGNFTGLIRGTLAISLLTPKMKKEEIADALFAIKDRFLSVGLTTVHSDDFISSTRENVMDIYIGLAKEGKMPFRIIQQMRIPDPKVIENHFKDLRGYNEDIEPWYKFGPLKMILDGTLGGKTAKMREPFEGEPDNTGVAMYTDDELYEITKAGVEHDLPLALHCIGDEATAQFFRNLERLDKEFDMKDKRAAVVHAQIIGEDQYELFGKYKAIANVQPAFLLSDRAPAEANVGQERADQAYHWRTILANGGTVVGGSDSPIESFDPILGIHALVNRRLDESEEAWHPDQCFTVEEAIYAYTLGPAYASYEENRRGSIKPDKLADFVILSDDITAIDTMKIKDVVVEKTYMDGKLVYEK